MSTATHPSYRSRGLTLLEVLIAVVILSIGLLGLAHLQLYGLESTGDSFRRSMAAYIANDLADRMRANRAATRGGGYDDLDSSTLSVPADPGCVTTFCTPTQMAQLDKREWLNHFVDVSAGTNPDWRAILDAGRGQVLRVGDRIQIVISWVNTEAAWDAVKKERTSQEVTHTFDVEFEL